MVYTTTIVITLVAGIASAACWFLYFSHNASAKREGKRMSLALTSTQAIFQCLDHIPNGLITREIRRSLVLIISAHLKVLTDLQPRHPYLWDLHNRLQRLNRIPSAFEKNSIRNRADRRAASQALEELHGYIKDAGRTQLIPSKDADLAAASALFGAQQIAVETARQAAKDAENMRAYKQALNFAYQAQALCKRLPPLMAGALAESVAADVERLEARLGRAA